MSTTLAFDVNTELVMTEEDGITALTKDLNPWQRIKASCMQNVKLKLIVFNYTSRVSELAKGKITASVVDNTINDDGTSNNILRAETFDVKSDVYMRWSHDVSLHINDLKVNGEAPIILRTEITDCTIKPGYSLGNIKVHIEMSLSNRIFKRISGQAFARITPRKIAELKMSNEFPQIKEVEGEKDLSVIKRSLTMPRKKYVVKNPTEG
ncbi:putative movement protein [Kenyan potato cytorhabdovirus]|uniref:Putative movement protein n=1 Tax=Kenyan potato cytorhabdovirus TaxID=2801326 RepID=A0A7T7FR10_9RHAB|nr:putative movement protein [Kenyan potato cytorhabdovirus]QQL94320.1 putative movement protein [Kenyan potato cytorhabdovirus]